MSILVNKKTRVLVQGITGKEGSRAAFEMVAYGTYVSAGVTPGKGGEKVAGIPVFNTVAEALAVHPEINTSMVAVPALRVFEAVKESIDARISLINILAENVPVREVARLIALSRGSGVTIVGPSSVGIISPGEAKIGSIGSSVGDRVIFTPGRIGVISKSGGMTAELSRVLSDSGFGQSTAVGIGGDSLICSDFVDIAKLFENDRETDAIVVFGEIGGSYEEKLAEAIVARHITKPVVAIIAGRFSERLPSGIVLGHAGAIVSRGRGSAESKIRTLTDAGVHVVNVPEDIPLMLKKIL